jgi:hypothetical protein
LGKSNTVTVTVTAPPKRKSILEISVTPTTGAAPLDITISGRLLDQDGITGLPSRSVGIRINDVLVGTVTTDTLGRFSLPYTLANIGTYTIYAEWAGDEYYEGCEEEKATWW